MGVDDGGDYVVGTVTDDSQLDSGDQIANVLDAARGSARGFLNKTVTSMKDNREHRSVVISRDSPSGRAMEKSPSLSQIKLVQLSSTRRDLLKDRSAYQLMHVHIARGTVSRHAPEEV
jgi:hypothetical protein